MDTKNRIQKLFKSLVFWGVVVIASSFVGGIGDDLRVLLISTITESAITTPITLEQLFRYIAPFMGIVILSWGIYKNKKNKEKQPTEDKLNELIQELQSFNKKWNKGILFLTSGYRNQIINRTIWDQNPEKIRTASVKIKRRNARLKEQKVKNASSVINSITIISDDIAKLGVDIENTVLTLRQEREALQKDSKVFEKFVEEGDRICLNIKSAIFELEKLRTNVL